MSSTRLNLSDLKVKSPKDLLSMAEELEIEIASTMRKGEIMFGLNMIGNKGKTVFIAVTSVHEYPTSEQLSLWSVQAF